MDTFWADLREYQHINLGYIMTKHAAAHCIHISTWWTVNSLNSSMGEKWYRHEMDKASNAGRKTVKLMKRCRVHRLLLQLYTHDSQSTLCVPSPARNSPHYLPQWLIKWQLVTPLHPSTAFVSVIFTSFITSCLGLQGRSHKQSTLGPLLGHLT